MSGYLGCHATREGLRDDPVKKRMIGQIIFSKHSQIKVLPLFNTLQVPVSAHRIAKDRATCDAKLQSVKVHALEVNAA